MQHNHSSRSISPPVVDYSSNSLPPASPLHRSISPYSNNSNGTQSPGPNRAYSRPLAGHIPPSPSSRLPTRDSKVDMYTSSISSTHLHPSLTGGQRSHTGPIRNNPRYRSSSRPSTASSMDDGGDASNYSDYEWRPDGMDAARLGRKDSVHSTRSAPLLIGESSSGESARALLANNSTDEGSGSYAPSLSSPTASSPTFTFVPHSAQPASGPLSLDSLPSYPPDQKPPFSYPVLIRLAILGSPQKRLLLSQIYSAIEDKFPWYRDSAPKAWKASVRHCLSLNKEFVRMQRAVEDPGVGCGGWWSVGEGMKGLKRPRKRRPPQSKRSENEADIIDTPIIKPPSPILRRRHSVHSNLSTEPYPPFISPASSSTTVRTVGSIPALQDYSLRLAPLQLPFGGSQQHLSSGQSSSKTLMYSGERDREDGVWGGVGRGDGLGRGAGSSRGHSHASTPSTSSSYSAQSRSDTSSMSGRRGNPMSISSLLNESNNAVLIAPPRSTSLLDASSRIMSPPTVPMEVETEDVEMKAEQEKDTPFSSEQTLRPPSPRPQGSSSRSRPPSSHDKASSHHRDKASATTRERPLSSRRSGGSPTSSSRPGTSSRRSATASGQAAPSSSSRKASPQQQQLAPAGSTRKKGSAKAWQSVMDLSQMEVESESE